MGFTDFHLRYDINFCCFFAGIGDNHACTTDDSLEQYPLTEQDITQLFSPRRELLR
jgi:hypothetical protein